jgi:hypothetical protein
MRKIIQKIICVLDGTSAEYRRPQRGQSLVELALFMPILIIMLTGLIEMGWYTNNYLILLEVSRVTARFGTTLTGDNDPLAWERGNITYQSTDEFGNPATFAINTRDNTLPRADYYDEIDKAPQDRNIPLRDCANAEGFYEAIVCLALDSMDPLVFNLDRLPAAQNRDDIIVSVFSLNLIPDPNTLSGDAEANVLSIGDNRPFKNNSIQPPDFIDSAPGTQANPDVPNPDAAQYMVTGRYPSMVNECGNDARDPFDLNGNNTFDEFELDSIRRDILSLDHDGDGINNTLLDTSTDEGHRGFSLTGRWVPRPPHAVAGCTGSEWNMYRIERLVNLRDLGLLSEEMERLPQRQALVLVEIAWNHQLLLNLPGFSPMFDILGGTEGSYIYVWAAFPTPTTEFFMDLNQSNP